MANVFKSFGGFNTTDLKEQKGIALMFDLAGYAEFYNRTGAPAYAPIYLNKVIEAVETCLRGGNPYWIEDPKPIPLLQSLTVLPIHSKFLGDAMLYVWALGETPDNEIAKMMIALMNRLWNLKKYFGNINVSCVGANVELPNGIRFGLATGSIFELPVGVDSGYEYTGVCINLASRLQSYCRELGFIAYNGFADHNLDLINNNYHRVKIAAGKIKGFDELTVFVDTGDFRRLEERRLKQTILPEFEEISPVPQKDGMLIITTPDGTTQHREVYTSEIR